MRSSLATSLRRNEGESCLNQETLKLARRDKRQGKSKSLRLQSQQMPRTQPSRSMLWDNRGDVKVREVVKLLEDDGWSVVRQRGSHRQFKHPSKPGLVTIAGKPGDDLAPGTLNSILKQAGLKS